MTVKLELPPEMERKLSERARREGTTPDALANDWVIERLSSEGGDEDESASAGSMAEFLEGYVGVFDSREFVPGGARLSEATGEQFADLLEEKRERGHI